MNYIFVIILLTILVYLKKIQNLIFKTSGSNNFIGNESLEIDKIADFDINLDFLNDISSVKKMQIAQS